MTDTYVPVPDLLYRGQQVYTLEASTAPSPSPTPTPVPAPVPTTQSSYPIGLLTDADKMWLVRYGMYAYMSALKYKPGSHQLLEDILTLNGRTVWEWAGALTGEQLQYKINLIKNMFMSGGEMYTPAYDQNSYTGPLRQVYKNLVALKLTVVA